MKDDDTAKLYSFIKNKTILLHVHGFVDSGSRLRVTRVRS